MSTDLPDLPDGPGINERQNESFALNSDSKIARRVIDDDAIAVLNKILGEYDAETQIVTSASMSSTVTSPSIDLEETNMALVRAVWSGSDGDDATLVIEISADDTNWSQLGESGIALNAAADQQIWQFIEIPHRYARVVFTPNSNTTGTLDIFWAGKS